MARKHSITAKLLILFFIVASASVFAQSRSVTFPKLEPDSKAIEYYNLNYDHRNYSWQQLAEISLWASGSAENTMPSNLDKIKSFIDAINNSPELPSGNKEKAGFILEFMHKNILRSYSLYQTRIDTLLSNGRFNCVSSAALYIILCESAGIKVSGVMTKDHAFAIIHIDGGNIDVETTNIYGFDPGNRKEFHDTSGNITGFAYIPAQNYRDRQTISAIELISLIMNNRIVDLERTNRYAEAVPIAIDRAALLYGNNLTITNAADTSGNIFNDPRIDLRDRLFNYGATLLRANREQDALSWAAAASPLYPDPDRWHEFIIAAVNNQINRLIRANRADEARTFLEDQRKQLTEADYKHYDSLILDGQVLGRTNRIRTFNEGEAVVNELSLILETGRLDERRARELLTFAIQKTAQILSETPRGNWRAAMNYIQEAIVRFGVRRELEQSLEAYSANLATEYHNRFAAEWNRRNFSEAERILNEGLAEFPNDRQLLRNKETVERQRGN